MQPSAAELRQMAQRVQQARKAGDPRYVRFLVRLAVRVGLSTGSVAQLVDRMAAA